MTSRGGGRFYGAGHRSPPRQRGAVPRKGARLTAGVSRQADCCAQVHHGLVKVTGPRGGNERLRLRFEGRLDCRHVHRFANIEKPAQDANKIPVHRRGSFTKSDTRNRTGNIGPEPREIVERFLVRGKISLPRFGDNTGGAVKISGAVVVAESFPFRKNSFEWGVGQRFQCWKPRDKPGVALGDRIRPSLLEHDLRYPDAVGVGLSAPRKKPVSFVIPAEQLCAHIAPFAGREPSHVWHFLFFSVLI